MYLITKLFAVDKYGGLVRVAVKRYIYGMENEVTTAEAAQILGVGPRQILWYHAHGLLAGRRIGERLLVFRRADVEAFEKPKKTGRPKRQSARATETARPKKGSGKVIEKTNGK
jgi:hypothetical protein